jgi:eukaryotic-like serine/threonine-protein kinase
MLEPGKQIAQHLRLVRELGEGGMGRVWVAEHQTLETEVAVKFLNRELAEDELSLARFRREAQAVAKIDSAHVVRVFDHGVTAENDPFIVMELLRGEDLRRRIQRAQRLGIDDAALILSQACKALGRAHALGIIHRDVKPANVFLTTEGNELFVKVLDFGVAKLMATQHLAVTDSRTVIGTPYYMSPEQVLSTHTVDHRADLWALGVMTYEMLTGVRPFEGNTLGAIHVKINAGSYMKPSELRAGLPAAVDQWLRRALDRDIERRFTSAQEMSESFRAAVGLQTRSSPSLTVSSPAAVDARLAMAETAAASVHTIGPRDRRSRLVVLLGLGLLLGAAAAWLLLREAREPAPAASPSIVWSSQRSAAPPEAPPGEARAALPDAERDAGLVPGVAASISPPAHAPGHRVRVVSAPSRPVTQPSAPASADPRRIKDRGF